MIVSRGCYSSRVQSIKRFSHCADPVVLGGSAVFDLACACSGFLRRRRVMALLSTQTSFVIWQAPRPSPNPPPHFQRLVMSLPPCATRRISLHLDRGVRLIQRFPFTEGPSGRQSLLWSLSIRKGFAMTEN